MWIASHLFHREPIACAAATLAASRNIGVVLMAMSPYTVHPIYAAMAAATLDEYFPGRVQLCFGVGAPRDLEAAGIVAEHPLQTLREALEISRSLLAGETINYSGERYKISGRRLAMGARPVPLWLAASGPHMLELAGEKADGVVDQRRNVARLHPLVAGSRAARRGARRAHHQEGGACLLLGRSKTSKVANDRVAPPPRLYPARPASCPQSRACRHQTRSGGACTRICARGLGSASTP